MPQLTPVPLQVAPTHAAQVLVVVLQAGRPATVAQSPSAAHWTQEALDVLQTGRPATLAQLPFPTHCTQNPRAGSQ